MLCPCAIPDKEYSKEGCHACWVCNRCGKFGGCDNNLQPLVLGGEVLELSGDSGTSPQIGVALQNDLPQVVGGFFSSLASQRVMALRTETNQVGGRIIELI